VWACPKHIFRINVSNHDIFSHGTGYADTMMIIRKKMEAKFGVVKCMMAKNN